MYKQILSLTLLVALCLISLPVLAAPVPPPLPADVNVIAPNPDVSATLAGLSGKWAGQYSWTGLNGGASGSRQIILVVEKIEGDQVSVIYSRGSDPRSAAGWVRVVGTYTAMNKLKVPLSPPFARKNVTHEFTPNADGTLSFWAPSVSTYGSDFRGVLKKQP